MTPSQATSNLERTTLVLDDHFSHDAFAAYMHKIGWTVRNTRDLGNAGERSREEVWGKDGVPVAVHYLDDECLWTKALWIRGSNIQPVLADLSPRFGGPTAHELVERVADAETTQARVVAIIQMAVGFADAFDPDVLSIFEQLADDDSAQIRGAVVQGLLYTQWEEGLPLLKRMAEQDRTAQIRDYAANALDHLSSPPHHR